MTTAAPQGWLLDLPPAEFVQRLALYSGPYVKIRLEPSRHEYKLPKALLCRQSTYFAATFEGEFKEGVEQSTALQEMDGVVSVRSFDMLVQWLYTGKSAHDETSPQEAITTILEFVRLADMCHVTGMEDLMAGSIKAIILGHATPSKAGKRTKIITYQTCLTSEHIMSAVLLPRTHSVRRILTMAAVPAFLNGASYLEGPLEIPDFTVDLIKEVQITNNTLQSDGTCITFQDLLSNARILLVHNEDS